MNGGMDSFNIIGTISVYKYKYILYIELEVER